MFDHYNVDTSFIIECSHLKIILIALYHDKTIIKLVPFIRNFLNTYIEYNDE